MRVNIDDKIENDPRITLAADRLDISRPEFIGRVIPVWMAAYRNRSAVMPRRNVDVLAAMKGFADAMIAEDLATPVDSDAVALSVDSPVRLRGVTERIEFLEIQDAKREKANAAKRVKAGLPAARPAGPPPGVPYSLTPVLTLHPSQPQTQTQAHAHDRRDARDARAPLHLDALRLARSFRSQIASASPGTKIAKLSAEASEEWAVKHAPEIEKLNRLDGIDWNDIEKAITFATSDTFWAPNVLSGKKLREKYDQLAMQMRRGPAKSASKAPDFTKTDYTAIPDWMKGAS